MAYYLNRYSEYAEFDGLVWGAYGPRLFNFDGVDQVSSVIELLKRRSTTRQAVIQLFDHRDLIGSYKDVPCTCSLQFFLRDDRLHLITYMRSNDVYAGLTHDLFAFTMIQEIIARTLEVDLGTYRHFVGSLHVYESDIPSFNFFLDEGWQESGPVMPRMPVGNPWIAIDSLLTCEREIRLYGRAEKCIDEPYWSDLATLLQAFAHRNDPDELLHTQTLLNNEMYKLYVRERIDLLAARQINEEH